MTLADAMPWLAGVAGCAFVLGICAVAVVFISGEVERGRRRQD